MSKVLVYGTPTCPYCSRAKEYFQNKNVDFDYIDVSSDNSKVEEMTQKSGQMGVPVIDIEGKVIVGFDQDKIEEALKG